MSILKEPDTHVRYGRDHSFWRGKKLKFVIIISMIFILLQLWFLSNLAYILGAFYKSEARTHNINLLLVDYDGGVVGQAVRDAYSQLQGPKFPTLQFAEPDRFPKPEVSLTSEVCNDVDIWGAIYIHEGASQRFTDALAGGEAANSYNSSDTFTYVVNEARYTLSVAVGIVASAAQNLASRSNQVLAANIAAQEIGSINATSSAALNVFAKPITAASYVIAHTPQAARALYNTAMIVLTIIPNMFFVMALNQNQLNWNMFSRATLRANVSFRLVTSLLFAMSTAAFATCYIWSFREDWNVTAAQGVFTWLELILYCHIHFLCIDICTAWVPMSGIPFIILFWIIANVASTIYPFELNPGFYKWGWALPAHAHYQNLITIWSHGCAPQLYRTLPILFSWWTLVMVVGIIGMMKRCNDAAKAELEAELAQQDNPSSEQGSLHDLTTHPSRQPASVGYGLPLPFQDSLHLRPTKTT